MRSIRSASLCAVFSLAGMLLLAASSGDAGATTVRNYTFPSILGLSGVLDRRNDTCIGCTIAQLSETISIVVTNNTGTRYSCQGTIRYYRLDTGAPDAFANSATKIIEPFTIVTVVSAKKFISDGRNLDLQATSLSCSSVSGGGSGGGGGTGSIDMSGTASYEIGAGVSRLSIARIENNTDRATGVLHLVLRANRTDSVSASGFDITNRIRLGSLDRNRLFANVSLPGSYTPPPDGQYFIYMVLVENDIAVDWVRFDPRTFSSSGGGSGNGTGSDTGDGGSGIVLEGNVSIIPNWGAGTVQFNVERLANRSSTVTTGTLRLTLWATTELYTGGNITGYRITTYQFSDVNVAGLSPGAQYGNVSRVVPVNVWPPVGSYYGTLVVSEYDPANCGSADGFCIVAYRSLSQLLDVPDAFSSGGSTQSAGDTDGGGGGASFSELVALGLLFVLYRPRRARRVAHR